MTRQESILNLLDKDGSCEVDSLAETFQVSTQTIRTDLRQLAKQGLVTRTHGGVRKRASASNHDYMQRRSLNAAAKSAIGRCASDLIPDHASVMLNIGTTTEQVAQALKAHEGLTAISNNINVINTLIGGSAKELILVGGSVRPQDGAIVGEQAVEFISGYKVDFAVIGASSLDSDGAVLDFDAREVAVARAILENARQKILVCDGSKFDVTAPIRISSVGELGYVITDRAPPEDFQTAANAAGTKIIIAEAVS